MSVVMKTGSVLFIAIAAFLIYAVIHAASSAGGARVGVCIGYVAGSLVLGFLAVMLWRKATARSARTA